VNCKHCNKQIFQRDHRHTYCNKKCAADYRRGSLGTCRIPDCGQKTVFVSENLCTFHYRKHVGGFALTNERSIRPDGTGTMDKRGYMVVRIGGVHKFEHVLIAEKALGKPLPKGAQVHHLNERKGDNRNRNLVVCPDDAYHKLLHKRARDLGIVFE
jgi:hypothetical protein